MDTNKPSYRTIDEYIAQFPAEMQQILSTLRQVIRDAAPGAEEKISYQMPAFVLHGNLVYFAVCKKHIGFYPTPSGIEAFRQELSAYKSSKGAVQFPVGKPLPYELIGKIVRFRVAENSAKAAEKPKRK